MWGGQRREQLTVAERIGSENVDRRKVTAASRHVTPKTRWHNLAVAKTALFKKFVIHMLMLTFLSARI